MNVDLIETNELSANSKGGTELMMHRLYSDPTIPRELIERFQIVPSRLRGIDKTKEHHILWLHDLPNDPESNRINEQWWRDQFDAIVCVSNWQLQQYNNYKGLPYTKSVVIQNAIEPISLTDNVSDTVRFIYHTTPHRGLEILVPVFIELSKEFDNIELDVYSSFGVYGWPERDEQYKALFDQCREHPKINYHGAVDNATVREALQRADIFAYPCIWPETSCLALIEAMSAGLTCVHPNYSALPETSSGLTHMYQWQEDKNLHARVLYSNLRQLLSERGLSRDYYRSVVKDIADHRFNWKSRAKEWTHLFNAIVASNASPSVKLV